MNEDEDEDDDVDKDRRRRVADSKQIELGRKRENVIKLGFGGRTFFFACEADAPWSSNDSAGYVGPVL